MSDPAMGLLNMLLDLQFEASLERARRERFGLPSSQPIPERVVDQVLAFIEHPVNSTAYICAVIALIDELVDQIERPDLIHRSVVDEDLRSSVIAADKLRDTLEDTRSLWDVQSHLGKGRWA
ncbi:MAG: hypothetical protein VBE63_17680 [Lamprobacter sp.]|uniref:hypothetical protein n=1 Tax=Lamprobacter sp. TaxID=3100796 RepID=UPI002B257CCE|nr:hypothetical protein [Lamprobacter sp.]MEA3641747.1 hypothetical protein [Lamprobacter sp.]